MAEKKTSEPPTPTLTFTEAPASWNVRAVSPAGYEVQLTLRSIDAGELMPRTLKALAWLSDQGFSPTGYKAAASNGGNTGGVPQCPTHNKPMKASQHGGYFCPVKIADDGGDGKPVYCKQKA